MNEDKIGRKLIQHDTRLGTIDAKLDRHEIRLDSIDAKLLQHDKRFDEIDAKLLQHDVQFNNLTTILVQHDDRLDRIEENMFTKEDGRKMMVIIENIATVVKDTRQEQKHMIKWLQRHDQILGLA